MSNLSYSPVTFRGKAAEPVFAELFFQNNTIANNLVAFETDVKASTIFTENSNTVELQAYVSGAPTTGGTLSISDKEVTPAKVYSYIEFSPETLRPSRFNRTMKPGAWEVVSTEFERTVLANYAMQVSAQAENEFWNATTSALAAATTNTASTVYNATTQEKAFAVTNGVTGKTFNGVVATLIENQLHTAVSGTTITSSNLATEYGKLYANMSANLTEAFEAPIIYAPKAHKQLVNIANTSATYRDIFTKEGGKYFYNDVEIVFVPLKANVMVLSLPSYIIWCTDLLSDFNEIKVDFIANNREDMFIKTLFTLEAHVVNQKFATLYVG